MSKDNITIQEAWNLLLESGVSAQTLEIVTDINGYTLSTLRDILYSHTGYRDFDQL